MIDIEIKNAIRTINAKLEEALEREKETEGTEDTVIWHMVGNDYKCVINAIEEIQQYRAIGTVEECREARERQRGKKPILCMNEVSGMFVDYADGHGEYKTQMNNWWRCPCCNEVVGQRVIAHNHIHDQRKKKFCEKCGQAISWESDTP